MRRKTVKKKRSIAGALSKLLHKLLSEIKGVESGAKVNKLQIDGIDFIQKISFDNLNEDTQFKNTV